MPAFARFLLAPLLLVGCSPTCRLELRFAYGGGPLDPALFQLTGKKRCPPGPVAVPPPIAPAALLAMPVRSDDAQGQEVTVDPAGLHVLTAFHGRHCTVRVTGFYDTNRDGRVNRGDLTASSPPIEVADSGLFRGNLTKGPLLRLTPIP